MNRMQVIDMERISYANLEQLLETVLNDPVVCFAIEHLDAQVATVYSSLEAMDMDMDGKGFDSGKGSGN
jgi:hypothetical protein